ncbi:PAS domain S-box protein, partial [Patescibacteria group bacterium]|nr:PAS domain S-box protein [Patescibacteria group bacterium]
MEIFNFALDLVLIGAAVWTIIVVRGSEGIIGRAFHLMMWGMILLGVAHISETITFEILKWEVDVVEFAHRLIVLGGIAFLVLGFSHIKKIQGERIEILEKSKIELEKKVRERTVQLEKSRQSVLNVLAKVEIEKANVSTEKEKIDSILHSIGDGVFVIDTQFRITIFNQVAANISGFSVKEALGKKYNEILKFVYEKDGKINDKFIKEAMATGEIREMLNHTVLIGKDGEQVAVADSAAPLKDKAGKVNGCVVVFRDVSKEREIDRAKSEFVSLASHQLRTPLTSINWYMEMLLSGEVGGIEEKQKEYLEKIYHNSRRMVVLVNALLNASRVELGTLAVEPKPINLFEIADSVLDELSPQIKKKELQIEKSYDKSLPTVNADPQLTRIVFQNLLSNSVKYTPENGTISLTIEKKEPNVLIKVSDNGYGIPKAQQSQIFKKLFRADNIKSKDPDGTGLGLYIVKSVVEQSGGKIWFESKENKGTTFYV